MATPAQRSQVDRITATLLRQVLDGAWPAGTRIPPERDLAESLEVSRASLRSAIARLDEWGVVSARQGSGIWVRPRHQWTLGVLGAALVHALEHDPHGLVALVRDALEVRRAVALDLVERAALRRPEDLSAARRAVQQAWNARIDRLRWAVIDREVLPLVLDAAAMDASVWLLNSLARPYLEAMATLGIRAEVPPGYLDAHNALLDAIEDGRAEDARAWMASYLDDLEAGLWPALSL
jgi:DNA-binding FadR family transcriptional regulator